MGVHVQPQTVLGQWPRAVTELTVRLGCLRSPGLPEYHSTGVVFKSLPCPAKEEVPLPPERDLPSHRHPSCGVGGSTRSVSGPCVSTFPPRIHSTAGSVEVFWSGGASPSPLTQTPAQAPSWRAWGGPPLPTGNQAHPASAAPVSSLSLEKCFPPARPGAGHVSSARAQGSGL